MQFKEEEVCRLITACKTYQRSTGSEDLWDAYDHLIHKLTNYGEEYSPVGLECTITE